MFAEHQPKWRLILGLITLVAVIVWGTVLLVGGVYWLDLLRSLMKLGLVSLIVWGGWSFLTKLAWRWPCLRWHHWLVSTPDLNGRWVGNYVSLYDKKERPMALEIRQSLLKLQCVAYSKDSAGEGYLARLLSDSDEQAFKLVCFYHAKREPSASIPGDTHDGFYILRIIEGSPRLLEGYYVNDRDPKPTKGDMKLAWESSNLKGRL